MNEQKKSPNTISQKPNDIGKTTDVSNGDLDYMNNKEEEGVPEDEEMEEEKDAFSFNRHLGTIEHFLLSEYLEKNSKGKLNHLKIITKGNWGPRTMQSQPHKISEHDDGKFYVVEESDCCMTVCLTAEYDGIVRVPMIVITANNFIEEKRLRDFYYELYQNMLTHSDYQGKYLQIGLDARGNLSQIEMVTPDEDNYSDLIIKDSSRKFVENFIRSVSKGNQLRYLFNGDAGTGKTECMRYIINSLIGNATIIEPVDLNPDNFRSFMDTIQYFYNPVLILDDVDLFLTSRDSNGGNPFLSNFLVYFDGIKKKKISVLASTNDKKLVDKAAERPGRFNLTVDFEPLVDEQVDQVINNYFPEKWKFKEVYDYMRNNDSETGKPRYITGAFVSNLVENLHEMEYDGEWDRETIVDFIDQNYKGFYKAVRNKSRDGEIKGFAHEQ